MESEKTTLQKIIDQKTEQIKNAIEQAIENGAKIKKAPGGCMVNGVYIQKAPEKKVAVVLYFETTLFDKMRVEELRCEREEIAKELAKIDESIKQLEQ